MRASQGVSRRVGRVLRYYYLRLVRIDDSPEKIGGGVALGVFLGIFPTFGLGLLLAVALAHRLHVNRAAALLGSVIMNPFTTVPFWTLSAVVGGFIFRADSARILAVAKDFENNWAAIFGHLGLIYAVGNTVVAAVFAAGFYLLTVRIARVVHAKRRARRRRRAERRASAAMAPQGADRADIRPHA